ncbi:ATP-binding protein [Deinococcus radiopugnans]|uniref:histidine kinase n=1 Tax=Deinococcus radiopugnans ATCC 19172 TaxID=585398 RepID=A0A5C4Y9J8_9DEIO|nr:ATP-binding protein [Deinococcus radiopugnans]MBB6016209.1 signal transduction histidine kinase [Deinococcus radiopugnans ATCC 19172]TNM72226.1 two-component sensor histidine kinase [Deinococcus radiopugnans ATCC 19172]
MPAATPPERFAVAAFDALMANIAIVDADGVIVAVNRAWTVFASENGGSSNDVGINYLSVCDAARGRDSGDAHAIAAGIRAVLAGEQPLYELEYPCHTATQPRYYVARVTRFEQDGAHYALVAHEDITRRKLAELEVSSLNASLERRVLERTQALEAGERDLQRLNTELTARNEELSQFVYVASHDLQEPLRTLGAYADILRHRYRGRQFDERADAYLGHITEQVGRARRLVRDVLALATVSEEAPREVTDLAEVCREVQAELDWPPDARLHAAPLPLVWASPLQMRQLLDNLLGNALKFHGAAPLRVTLSAEAEGELVHFILRDNGIGIAPEHTEKVFGMFQRLHGRTATGGNGIGLAVCRRIVERHGGRIWIEAAPGGGSALHFTLPVAQDDAVHLSAAGERTSG